jgi:hypothetical protein
MLLAGLVSPTLLNLSYSALHLSCGQQGTWERHDAARMARQVTSYIGSFKGAWVCLKIGTSIESPFIWENDGKLN